MAKKSVAKRSASKRPVATSTKSANAALSVAQGVEARAAAVTSNRWATLKNVDEAFDKNDPRKEVINISIMENGPPDPKDLAAKGNENAQHYSYQQVSPSVIIGMREGGPFESVDGFGWKDAADKAAHGNPVGSGSTRIADATA